MELFCRLLAGAVVVPVLVLVVECCAALLPRRRLSEGRRPRVDVLIPAHDEESGLAATLRSVAADLRADDRILVVADNCTDHTADVARKCGVYVVERSEPTQRGKGFALEFGLRQLSTAPDEIVVVVDADCRVAPGSIDRLARMAAATDRPVQANYVMTCPVPAQPRDLVGRLAVVMKNQVRQRGLTALGGAAVLTGSGMAFPRHILDRVRFAGDHLVEDMQMTFDLLTAGFGPRFCAEAVVLAPLPKSLHASRSQRTRWEHGHLQTLIKQVPRLVCRGLVERRPALSAAALDLAVPPLSLLVLMLVAALCVTAGCLPFGGSPWPCVVIAAGILLLAASVLVAQVRFGQGSVWPVVLAVPRYVLGKLPIYATFLVRRQRRWVRTDRDVEPARPHRSTIVISK